MWNCTHFRYPTDEQLQNSDMFRSHIYLKPVPFELEVKINLHSRRFRGPVLERVLGRERGAGLVKINRRDSGNLVPRVFSAYKMAGKKKNTKLPEYFVA